MYIAAFALLAAAGAWGAWHSSPSYSTKLTLRYIAVTLCSIAIAIFAIVATLDLTEHRSEAVQLGSIAAVTLLCTLGMIWLIMTASVPKRAIPQTARLLTIHRRKLVPWIRRFGWLVFGTALLAVVLHGEGRLVVFALGGLAIFLGIVMLFTANLAAVHFDRSLTSVESNPWIHWHYTPDQWNAWSDAEVGRLAATSPPWLWRRDWKSFLTSFAAIAAAVFALDSRAVSWQWNLGVVTITGLVMFGLIVASQNYGRTAPYALRRLLASAAPEAFFGDAGVYADGVYTEWRTVSGYLVEASLDERSPRSLSFVFEKYVGGTINVMTQVRQNVLIPLGADGDVAELQLRIRNVCPSARVTFV